MKISMYRHQSSNGIINLVNINLFERVNVLQTNTD